MKQFCRFVRRPILIYIYMIVIYMLAIGLFGALLRVQMGFENPIKKF